MSQPQNRLRNLAVRGVDQLTRVIKSDLEHMQYRPDPPNAIIAETGLNLAQPTVKTTFQPR